MKKLKLSAILALALMMTIPANAQAYSNGIYVVKDNLPYDSAWGFSEGFSKVGEDTNNDGLSEKWGLIDESGNEAVPLRYNYIGDVSGGMAKVGNDTDKNGGTGTIWGGQGVDKWGFVDTNGNEVVPLIYDAAENFSEGLALVSTQYQYVDEKFFGMTVTAYKTGFVDKTGKVAIPLIYDRAQSFSEGLAAVTKDGKAGFINARGNVIIPLIYDFAGDFNEGLAMVGKGDKRGFIDKQGNVVVPVIYDQTYDFSEGLAVVGNYSSGSAGCKFGFVDNKGKVVVPLIYDSASGFSEGVARVATTGDGVHYKYGFVDKTGKVVIPLIYTTAFDFSDDLAIVQTTDELNKNYSVIDKNGNAVLNYRENTLHAFSDGVSVIGKDTNNDSYGLPDVFGAIDRQGNLILPFEYMDIHDFNKGFTTAKAKNGKWVILGIKQESQDTITARPIASKVTVNGVETVFDAYIINQNNYFKLRDVANVISGTEKQFEVTWDGDKNAIDLIAGKPYTTVGGEMGAGDSTAKNAQANTASIYLNGEPIPLTAYTIAGNNYFKLRDIGKTFNFGVAWDAVNNTIVIDATKDYAED